MPEVKAFYTLCLTHHDLRHPLQFK